MAGDLAFPRQAPPQLDDEASIEFQVLDWFVPESDKAQWKLRKYKNGPPAPYEIIMYGSTASGHSVTAFIQGFEPYFYIRPPASWTASNFNNKLQDLEFTLVEQKIMNKRTGYMTYNIPYRLRSHLVHIKKVARKDFWGFTNGKEFAFIEVKVKSLALFNVLKRYFASRETDGFKLYESNIDPFLRFIHERSLQPCGWVRLNGGTYEIIDPDANETASRASDGSAGSADAPESIGASRTSYNIRVQHQDVHFLERASIAPLLIAAFDIECTSSHGDFPVAQKDYRKLTVDIVAAAKQLPVKEVTNALIAKWIYRAFKPAKAASAAPATDALINQVYPKNTPNYPALKDTICNTDFLDDATELVHKALQAANAKVKRGNAAKVDPEPDADRDEPDADRDADHDVTDAAGPPKQGAAEIELNALLTKHLPALKGDSIIQIGTTVNRYGSPEIIYRHIASLGSCDPIEGADVESFDTEEDLLLGWKDLIVRLDPDIITGYNIFGFDFKYVWERAKELDVDTNLGAGIGRLMNRQTTMLEARLSSSALGDNFLYYIDLDGVVLIDMYKVMNRDHKLDSYKLDAVAEVFLGDHKNDMKPYEIFEKFKGSSADRAEIARYCLQDCALCNRLIDKLKVLENNIGMGNVCSVPLSYLFMRGQGVKIFSLVSAECRIEDTLIPVVCMPDDYDAPPEVGYEGAIVLEPKEGIYMDDAITVFDYASLYPSSMISRDLSHDRFVVDPEYASIEGVKYETVSFDLFTGVGDKKLKTGECKCTFAQAPGGRKGIIPSILDKLLKQRKNTRKKIEYETLTLNDGRVITGLVTPVPQAPNGALGLKVSNIESGESTIIHDADTAVVDRKDTYNAFEKAVLDALQLAYKITANSLYGQIGSRTSAIYWKEIAACTTATGREMIMLAKEFMEKRYEAEVIYGDTDSIFCKFPFKDADGNAIKGKDTLAHAIAAGQRASKEIKSLLPDPQCLEYEKTFYPFILFSKKRYVGNLYEDDPNKKPKQKSMGIVLKRRDNAPIVKKIYGGIIDIILNKHDLPGSIDFLKQELDALRNGTVKIEELIISKTLRAEYKDPTKIAHKVLADRMGDRDAGNKPQANDRIPFVYIKPVEGTIASGLQGDRIEHPEYIKEQGLTPDYLFYITNQLTKPICQLYALCVNDLPEYSHPVDYWITWDESLRNHKLYGDSDRKRKDRISALKIQEVESIMFESYVVALGGTKRRMAKPKTPKQGPKGSPSLTDEAITLSIEVTEDKEAKLYRAMAKLKAVPAWSLSEEIKKKTKITQAQVYRTFSETVIETLYKLPEYTAIMENEGIRIRISNARFVNLWNAAIETEYENKEKYEASIANQDIGSLKALTSQNVFARLVNAGDSIKYIVEKPPAKTAKTAKKATGAEQEADEEADEA